MNNSEVPDYGLDDRYRIETGLGVHQDSYQSKQAPRPLSQVKVVGA
jgi:hypothetical protein